MAKLKLAPREQQEQNAFLHSIHATPDDDAPRLIYADWLEDHGDAERAAFIRAQCRVESMGRFDLARYDAEAEAGRLLGLRGTDWRQPLATATRTVEFRRGFPHGIALTTRKFAEQGDLAVATAPTLRELRVTDREDWDGLLATPALVHFTSFEAGRPLGRERLEALANSSRHAGLRELRLIGSSLREAVQAFADSPHLANLRWLGLQRSGIGDAGLDALLGASFAKNLTGLDLRETGLSASSLRRLASWEGASRLEELHLVQDDQDEAGASAFAAGDWRALSRLTFFLTRRNSGYDLLGLSAQGLAALVGCRSLSRLRSLSVRTTRGVSLAPLFESPNLAGLEELVLSGDGSASGLQALAKSPMLANLRSLTLEYESLPGLAAVLGRPAAGGLRELSLGGETRGRAGVAEILADAPHLSNLRRLRIEFFDASKTETLAQAEHLADLLVLDLHASPGAEGFEALADSPHLNRLRRLRLSGWPELRKRAMTRLKRRYGEDVVSWSKYEPLSPGFERR